MDFGKNGDKKTTFSLHVKCNKNGMNLFKSLGDVVDCLHM